MSSDVLELYDLDGTMNDIDVESGLAGESGDEVQYYFIAAAEFVAEKTGLSADEVFGGMKVAMLGDVFSDRAKWENWASFPAVNKSPVRVAPAVDHYLLTPRALEVFLNKRLIQEGDLDNELTRSIKGFLASNWKYPLYVHASEVSLPHSHVNDDALRVIEDRLRKNALATVFTNSSAAKAEDLLRRAGFGNRVVSGSVERGKIGVIGGAAKYEVDHSLAVDGRAQIDLSDFYGPGTVLDLRRKRYQDRVAALMSSTGARRVAMFTDIPELDSYPLQAWYGDKAIHGMKTNQSSAPESVNAAQELLGAKVSAKLSDLVVDL